MDVVNESSISGSLHFVTGLMAGKTFQITKPVTRLGRGPENDIIISDPSVSRHHAQITWNGQAWSIQLLAEQNNLAVNQLPTHQSLLHDGDTIGLGQGVTFVFSIVMPQAPGYPSPVSPLSPPASPNPYPERPSFPGNQPIQQQQANPYPAQQVSFPGNQPIPQANPYPERLSFPGNQPMPAPPVDRTITSTSIEGSTGPSVPSIEISTNTDHETQKYMFDPAQTVFDIGRNPSNAIVINRPTVSSFHAQIIREGNQLVLIHPNPKRGHTVNGITFQGQRILGNEPFRRVLTRGDIFRISDSNGTFVTLAYNDGSGRVQDAIPEIQSIQLGAPVITIGRAPDNMVVLNHPQISGHHARLEQNRGGYRLIDLGSTNHSYVNAQRVSNRTLEQGDIIRIGPYKLTYTGTLLTQQDESYGIRVDALNLRKEGNQHTVLINDISIAIPPRKFVALVGGSGAGKSTLMDALNGLRPAQQGAVLYNGQDYYHNLAAFSTQLGYVPQDDIIHRDLTVERALYYAAKLRLPEDFSSQQIKERIDEALEDVEMKHRRHLPVSKLSGGQRKRVSIALELLAKPSIFFLDEPTSGLDPGLDRKMMLLLRKLADKGQTIVLVTHATNNINACDYICFLSQGGRLAYFGPPNDAKAYFGKTDFAEIYSALEPTDENPNIPDEAEARFRQSPDYQRYVVQQIQQGPAGQGFRQNPVASIKPVKRGNPWQQFFLLCMRYLELIFNDRVNLAILILQAPIIGLLLLGLTGKGIFNLNQIATCQAHKQVLNPASPPTNNCQFVVNFLKTPQGVTFAQQSHMTLNQTLESFILPGSGSNAQKILFIMSFAAIMFGCINGSREIVKEAAIYRRERAINLGIAPYLFSKIAVLGAFSLLQSLILVVLVSIKAPYRHSILFSPFLEIYITMALTSLTGLMTGLLISAIVPNNDRAMSIVPLTLIPQVIFSGVIFSLDMPHFLQIPAAFFSERWAMAAMGTSVGLHGDKLGSDTFSYVSTVFATVNGSNQGAAVAHLLLSWGVLIALIVVQGFAISWFLKRKDVRR